MVKGNTERKEAAKEQKHGGKEREDEEGEGKKSQMKGREVSRR